jgi:hypothetical protein
MDFTVRRQPQPPQPPSAFFDGTRLGLEGSMLATLIVAIPAGVHIALAATLGYAVRYVDGLPAQANPFSLSGFIFAWLLAIIALAMLGFFVGSIPTMGYSVVLVVVMLRWVGKRRGREKLVSTIAGSVCGLLTGGLESAAGFLLMNLTPSAAAFAMLFRWPAIMSVDGIALLWLTVNTLANAIAGAQIGFRLGKQLEELTMYYFW